MNIASYVQDGIRKYGEYEQFIFIDNNKKTVLTNVEIDRRARAVATGLINTGVAKGDIVGVMVSNIPEIPELMNGIMRMGGVFLPIIFMLTPREIRYILEDSRVRIIITEKSMYPKIKEALEGNHYVDKIIVIGADHAFDLPDQFISYEKFINQGECLGDILDLSPDDLAILMYTSGSTGFPKGVMLSQSNLAGSLLGGAQVWPCDRTDIYYICLPMNHSFGINSFYESCYFGAKMILVPKFDPVKTLECLTEYKATVCGMVPTMIIMMMRFYDSAKYSLQSMKYLVSSGAPMAEETLKKAQEMFGVKLFHGYGCTEASPTIARQRADRKLKVGSVGPVIPGMILKLIDDDGKEVPLGETGEIIVQGPGVMKGYLNKPKETEETLRGGWLHTGDLGQLDEDGELYVVGRKKDLIIKGGENIDPGVSENILLQHPAVLMAATIAIPDAKYGEEVGSAVILKPGQQATENELLGYVGEHLHHFVTPKRIFIMSAFPMTVSGKVLKREIKEIVKSLM